MGGGAAHQGLSSYALGVSRELVVNSYTFFSLTCCNISQTSPPRLS